MKISWTTVEEPPCAVLRLTSFFTLAMPCSSAPALAQTIPSRLPLRWRCRTHCLHRMLTHRNAGGGTP